MIQIPESILKRNEQRQDEIQKKKDEGPSPSELFRENFKEQQLNIERILDSVESIEDRNKLADTFSQISKDLNVLNRYFSTSSIFLIPYDIKICKTVLQNLQDRLTESETKLLPKKKFGFSKRKDIKKTEKVIIEEKSIDVPDIFLSDQSGFSDRKNEKLFLSQDEVNNKDISLNQLENCEVSIEGTPNTIYLVNISKCKIFCGPVMTSVLVENCKDSILVLACQQLRIHNTTDTDFYIHVTTKAIIEDSNHLRFAPYKHQYENIEEHYEISGLNRESNNWDKVDDFNWLVSNKPSPNWSILPQNERLH